MAENNSGTEDMLPVGDLASQDPVAIERWPIVVDYIVSNVVDRPRIKEQIGQGGTTCAQGILNSLRLWQAAGGDLSGLIVVLRQRGLVALADRIIEQWPDAITKSIMIMRVGAGNRVRIALQILLGILAQVGDRPLAIFSINGKMRTGKSFMLNQFLKYLKLGESHPHDWISRTLPKTFIWQGGKERVTAGIQIWSEIFPIQVASGREVAVLLLDVQGLHDFQTDTKEDALMFAFSTLLSSVSIFNVQGVGAETFQYLQTFIETAKLAVPEEEEGLAFQKMILLLRDYSAVQEHGFGLHDDNGCPPNRNGAHENLKRHYFDDLGRLAVDAKLTRERIRACFKELSVMALPFPGTSLTETDNSDPAEWDPRFKTHVTEFVQGLFSPASVQASLKCVGDDEMTGTKLKDFVTAWTDLYTDQDRIPDYPNVMQAIVDVQGKQNVQKALRLYTEGITQMVRDHPIGLDPETFTARHAALKASSLKMLQAARAIGGRRFQASFLQLLTIRILEAHAQFSELNTKNLATTARLAEEKHRREVERLFAIQAAEINLNQARQGLELNQQLKGIQAELQETRNLLLRTRDELEQLKCNAQKQVSEVSRRLSTAQEQTSFILENPVPVGFIYVQFPNQPDPQCIWPKVSWENVTSTYAGHFFRAEGGNSAMFGSIQEDNCHRIISAGYVFKDRGENDIGYNNNGDIITIPKSGRSAILGTGAFGAYSAYTGMHFTANGGEVRPINVAVRIWKRI